MPGVLITAKKGENQPDDSKRETPKDDHPLTDRLYAAEHANVLRRWKAPRDE